jgi:hypothetical protein
LLHSIPCQRPIRFLPETDYPRAFGSFPRIAGSENEIDSIVILQVFISLALRIGCCNTFVDNTTAKAALAFRKQSEFQINHLWSSLSLCHSLRATEYCTLTLYKCAFDLYFLCVTNNGSTSMCKTDLQPCKLYQIGVKSFQAVTYFIKDNTKPHKTQNMG